MKLESIEMIFNAEQSYHCDWIYENATCTDVNWMLGIVADSSVYKRARQFSN